MTISSILHCTRKRLFHASSKLNRKFYDVVIPLSEAEKPISIPPSVNLRIHRIPVNAFPPLCPHGKFSYAELSENKVSLRNFRESSVYHKQMAECTAVVEIRGPLGVGYVPVPEWLDFHVWNADSEEANAIDIWHGQGSKGGNLDHSTRIFDLKEFVAPIQNSDRFLRIKCLDPENKLLARHWGFYKRRIERYVKNTVSPAVLPLRLVGVGYRALLEDVKVVGTEKNDYKEYQSFILSWVRQLNKSPMRKYLAQNFPDSIWGQVERMKYSLTHKLNKRFTVVFDSDNWDSSKFIPPKKVVLKLGYSHNVEIIVPPFINISIPSVTTIILSGLHIDKLTEFATSVRKWRKPEPYKGKGIFVGNETITLKSKKVK